MANDLAAVLYELDYNEPVLLAGLSLGVLPIQLFACQNPSAVAGLLLLDPTPDQMMVDLSKQPPQVRDLMRANMVKLGASDAAVMECERIVESGVQVAECIEAHGLPDVPSIVAVAERPASSPLPMLHQDMAGRLPRGRLVRVPDCRHETFLEENEDRIVGWTRELLP